MRFAGLGFLGAALASLGAAQGWGDRAGDFADAPEYAGSKAICRALKHREPPASDRPGARETMGLRGCDSEALYYGIGRASNPPRARQCAFVEAAGADPDVTADPFTGRGMLMTIYANGVGARRDLDLATRYACELDGAPAEMDGRVTHLQARKARSDPGRDFHFCDDITSGLAGGHCAAHEARIAGARRKAAFARLTAGWPDAHLQALARVQRAHETFAQASASGEQDQSGTLRAALTIGAEESLRDQLLNGLQALAAGRAPATGSATFAQADARLNAAYRARLREVAAEMGQVAKYGTVGGVTTTAVRVAQRAWLRYRDAFLAFAAQRYPQVARDRVAAWLTDARTAMLVTPEG